MSCPWCANPEGMCMSGCMMQQGSRKKEVSKEMSLDEMLSEAQLGESLFFEGGGVTFTGGEPTMQFDELKKALEILKENGINTAVETNGSSGRLSELFELIDNLIMDFKHPDNEEHIKMTGVPNENTKKNIRKAAECGKCVAIRIPLIHGFNDTEEALAGFLKFFSETDMKNNTVEILPYHEFGKKKWEDCGRVYTMQDAFVTEKRVKEFEDAIKGIGVKVVRT